MGAPRRLTTKLKQHFPVTWSTQLAGSQVLRVWYGTPSIPGESVSAGGLGTGQFNVICPGWVVKPGV